MADADGRIIPLVEDDQGEGIKDFIDDPNDVLKKLYEKEEQINANARIKETLEKGKADSEMLEIINNKLDRLLYIFGDYKLINGKWVDTSPLNQQAPE